MYFDKRVQRNAFYPVASAFGGIGVYKYEAIKDINYQVVTLQENKSVALCEHIPFHNQIKDKGYKIGMITDGRPNGQRNKIAALGVDKLIDDIIITDELGGAQFRKPCDIAFRIMQKRLGVPYKNMVYVGDNASKDFTACKELGLKGILFANTEGLY